MTLAHRLTRLEAQVRARQAPSPPRIVISFDTIGDPPPEPPRPGERRVTLFWDGPPLVEDGPPLRQAAVPGDGHAG